MWSFGLSPKGYGLLQKGGRNRLQVAMGDKENGYQISQLRDMRGLRKKI